MPAIIGANSGSFTLPSGLSQGTHTIQIRETNNPSVVSPPFTFSVAAPAVIAPALGTTGLLLDIDPNTASTVTTSGGIITQLTGANGTGGTITASGSPTLATLSVGSTALSAIKFNASTSDYLNATSAALSKIVSQLGSGALTAIAVIQPIDTNGFIFMDASQKSGAAFANRAAFSVNGSTFQARSIYCDANSNSDIAIYGSAPYGSGSPVLVIAQFQQSTHPLVTLNHASVVAGTGTVSALTLANLDTVLLNARSVSGAANTFGNGYLLRFSIYSGSNLTAGSAATTIANWATTNYGAA